MPLSEKEIQSLLRMVDLTKEDEINCDQCLAQVAAFAEQELAGRSIPDSLVAIEHHLAVCGECREEYKALQRALEGLEG